jgi:hypothetical protein
MPREGDKDIRLAFCLRSMIIEKNIKDDTVPISKVRTSLPRLHKNAKFDDYRSHGIKKLSISFQIFRAISSGLEFCSGFI